MKIAVDCRFSGKSGIGTFLDNILPHLLNSDLDLFLFGPESLKKDFLLDNYNHVKFCVCNTKSFSIREIFGLSKAITKEINSCDAYFTPYCNIPGKIHIPIYATIHDVIFLDIPSLASLPGRIIRKAFYKRAILKSECIFTVSNFSKERILYHFKTHTPIEIVYNGVSSYVNKYKLKDVQKNTSIVFVGNLKAHKGLQILLPAFIEFRKEMIENNVNEIPKLLIVGSKENFRTKDMFLQEYMENSFENGIEFTGFIENEKLCHKLCQARMLVQPSLYEGFGLPPLEALTCSTKVIMSDIPVFKEIYQGFPVTFFKTNSVFSLKEKMKELWDDYVLQEPIPTKYSYKNTTKRILKIIKKV